MKKKVNVGGQAVIEGVMMRGEKGIATAVRTAEDHIEINVEEIIPFTKRNKFFSLPFIRGFISLMESLIMGIKTLNYSAAFFEEEGAESKVEELLNKWFKGKANEIITGITLIISLAISMVIFFFIPTATANIFKSFGFNTFLLNIIEGFLRVCIFLIYIYFVSKMEDIYRLFQYHGAEHKTIFCYENDKELTVENAMAFSRLHPRCGTNFIFLVMIVSILLFSLTGWSSLWQRFLYRILLLPLVSGITYEIIKWLGKSEGRLSKIVAYPGLKLQLLTTKEPDKSQLEVAIAALKAAEGIKDPEKTIGELLDIGNKILKEQHIDSAILDCQLLLSKVLKVDRLYVITHREEIISYEKEKDFCELIEKRKNKMPVKYILGSTEFMGLEFKVEPGVLIPRADTEILVEEVLQKIKLKGYNHICDLCCGSSAIGVSLAHYLEHINVDCIDISQDAKRVTEYNIKENCLEERVKFIHSDLLKYALDKEIKYDTIVSNPPYIKKELIPKLMEDVKLYEPTLALDGGVSGLDFYERIVRESLQVLEKGGLLAFEIGYDQGEVVATLLKENGYKQIEVIKDLAGLDRVVLGIY